MRVVMRPVASPGGQATRRPALPAPLTRMPLRLSQLVIGIATATGAWLLVTGPIALAAATLSLAATVALVVGVSLVWDSFDESRPDLATGKHAEAFQSQAAGLVTLQGVVLTLVLTLADQTTSTTIKAGGVALVIGVLFGLVLAGLVALGISGQGQLLIATLVFNLTVWSCAYGLLCLAAALVLET